MAEPFIGLTPYQEIHAAYFFGRASERRVLVDNLLSSRLTLLYGESGTGKSSLLNTGVARELRPDQDFTIVVFRTWRDDPRHGLSDAIRAATGCPVDRDGEDLFDLTRRCARAKKQTLLILLDQFEEYFHDHPTQHEFDGELARLLTEPNVPANLLIVIREDWLAALDSFKGRIPGLFDNYLRMQHLTRDGAREAIEGPLIQFNNEQTNGHNVGWDETLTSHVIKSILDQQTTAERGLHTDDRVQAPYLQLVMQALWNAEANKEPRKLRIETLENELRGAKHIYQNHLAATLKEKLTPEQRTAAVRMFRDLVTGSGRKQTRTASELSSDGVDAGVTTSTLNVLHTARILSQTPPPRGSNGVGYEFAHDVLADAALRLIRQEALDAERAKAEDAERRAHSDAATARRLRVYSRLLGASLIAALTLGVWAWHMRNDATLAADLARAAAARADTAAKSERTEKLRAEREANLNLVRELIQATTATQFEANHELAVLLASHAVIKAQGLKDAVIEDAAANALRFALIGVKPSVFETSGLPMYVAVAPSGARVAVISPDADESLQVWNVGSEKPANEDTAEGTSLGWSADGRWLAIGNAADDSVKVFDDKTWKVVFDNSDAEDAVGWHPSARQLATGSTDDEVVIWEIPSGKVLGRWKAHDDDITAIAWSPDGTRIATGSEDSYLRVWDVKTRRRVFQAKDVFETDQPTVAAITWDTNGDRLVTSDPPQPARIWTLANAAGKRLDRFPVSIAALSHTAPWIALSAMETSVRVLDAATLDVKSQLPIQGQSLSVAWSQDHRALAITSMEVESNGREQEQNPRVRLHDSRSLTMATSELLSAARARVSRALTVDECRKYLRTDTCPSNP